jgi:hypothetical protein
LQAIDTLSGTPVSMTASAGAAAVSRNSSAEAEIAARDRRHETQHEEIII